MNNQIVHQQMKDDLQIKKFCVYGFLKNLKFFEAYLILFLLSRGINLFQVGILVAVREIIVNVFEIPSGFIADYFGRKKELYLCFCFYILSFFAFFICHSFWIAVVAMVFFGLGEAFRSGTHKAMICTYLDKKDWVKHTSYVYGRTRSFSLIGSAISSIAGIVLVLIVPDIQYIFLFSMIPYVLDLILIMTYPNYLDNEDRKQGITIREFYKDLLNVFKSNKTLRNLLVEEGFAEGIYSYSKDFIQPIMELIIVGSGVLIIANLSVEDNLKVVLGVIYAIFNLCGSYFSKKAYLLTEKRTAMRCLFYIHMAMLLLFMLLALFIQNYIAVIVAYVVLYILHSVRKPIFVEEVDSHIEKSIRATVLSMSAQLKSLFLIIFAPIAGFISDTFGIYMAMVMIAVLFAISIPLLRHKN